MRKRRTIYFNDARHYYLFAFEPPMRLEDAWVPVDEVAGTAVDTLAYGVERGDGLFYPSKVGLMFGSDMLPFRLAAYWRTWHNMQSLIDRGLDPLAVLVERAHDKGMDFWASLRMAGYGGMAAAHKLDQGGGGLAHTEVREHQLAVATELIQDYETQAIELDFALPGGGPRILRQEDVEAMTPVLTDYVEAIAAVARRKGCAVGARVLPTEAMNLDQGLDVREWLRRGLVDFVVPMRYGYMILDGDMPIDWLVEAAGAADAAVYGVLQPYVRDEQTGAEQRIWAGIEEMRAAGAGLLDRGCDGLYAWFMRWPLGADERSALSELGDGEGMKRRDKRYVLARRVQDGSDNHYPVALPIEIAAEDRGWHEVRFYVADDFDGGRVSRVVLRLKITDLVSDDRLAVRLNGASLEGEVCRREYGWMVAPYQSMWLEFELQGVRPRTGGNVLEVQLGRRPEDLVSGLVLEEVEVKVEYHPLPVSG